MQNKLGIIGGLGSIASAYFYEMIIKNTKVRNDQEHIDMIILNHASLADRTSYILDNTQENPLPGLLEDVKLLNQLGCKMIAIPCNTSCYFHEQLQKESKIPVSNLIEDTIVYLEKIGARKIYILATDGTISTNLYQDCAQKHDIKFRIPTEETQRLVMSIIYDEIKKGQKVTKEKWDKINECLEEGEYVILGCTELSILKTELKLDDRYIDPLLIQTNKIITFFEKNHI